MAVFVVRSAAEPKRKSMRPNRLGSIHGHSKLIEEEEMIIRLVKFKSALSDAEVLKLSDQRAPRYRNLPGLIQKYYFKDKQTGEHGAVYLWDSMESMEEFQNSELSHSIPEAYKIIGQPKIEILDLVYTLRSQ
jgi:heme-degrading monooxygenase HmoA